MIYLFVGVKSGVGKLQPVRQSGRRACPSQIPVGYQ